MFIVSINISVFNCKQQLVCCEGYQIFILKRIQRQPPEMFYKKGVLRTSAKFTGKHLCQSLVFTATLLKKTLAQVFSCEFCKISKSIFFTEHLRWTASGESLFNSDFRTWGSWNRHRELACAWWHHLCSEIYRSLHE